MVNWRSLVCAACSRPVVDGWCPTCRAMRSEFLRQRGPRADLLAAAVLLVLLLTALLSLHR